MKRVLQICIIMSLIYFIVATFLMISAAKHKPTQNAEYILILGARVYDDRLSLALKARMDKALIYLHHNTNTKVIVSGGQGHNETIAEGVAMERYLLEQGISQERILVEDRATSTYENIKYTMDKFSVNKVVLVSNDFHMYRAKLIAKRLGMETESLAAPTPWKAKPKSYVREYIAILKTWLFDQ
ncbi:YdcF family protein [Ectobacillus sp. JY-23]|uniref:YdcF family protein n=1 Tax=Ectobacillus sp. JY-23 TaxID=2933872 RepID=UPI001FF4D07F|nr:YdcF family protein [Ectobacillus sp. JY-23]UOY92929.1 YdcF family protein [Ectobacillus sp. JY-23]